LGSNPDSTNKTIARNSAANGGEIEKRLMLFSS
jgi:hypothetical protein